VIYCIGCNNELDWEEDTQEDGTTIYYTCMCDECDENHIALHNVVSTQIKPIGRAVLGMVGDQIGMPESSEKQATREALAALIEIGEALHKIGGKS